jgi:mannose-6-phosphate isomerase-like protein (cupin superfamily)
MTEPLSALHVFGPEQVSWQLHPTVPNLLMKVFENRENALGYDAVLVQVLPGNIIGWHVHAEANETVYIVQGTGEIYGVADEAAQVNAAATPLVVGTVVTIPKTIRHSVINTGSESLIIVAFHSPATL